MINVNKKSEKGITLATLAIAIIIMLIITSTLIYNISTGARVKTLNNMYQDITKLKDKVNLYYANHHTIPIIPIRYESISHIQSINPNDNDNYYVVDLEALENIDLTYGKDYASYKETPSNYLMDLYVINERSHSIYYVRGIPLDDKTYYTIPEENTEVTVNDVLNLESIGRYKNDINVKIYAVDKTNGIKKLTLMIDDEPYKTYEYNSDYREIKTEIEPISLTEKERSCYFQIEGENGNIKNSNSITLERKTVEWVADGAGNEIPVPIGFSPITTKDQGTKNTGFVIKNNTDNNEYVWVPVDDTTPYSYDRVAFSRDGWTRTQTKGEIDSSTSSYKIIRADQAAYYYTEAMPNIAENRTELQSVTQYKGFYIGRYEVGITGYTSLSKTSDGTESWTGYSNGTAVVQKGKQVWNYITKNKAKEIAESMYATNNAVISKLCSSYAWDTTLKFIETNYPEYPTNSLQGNYKDTTFEYTDLDGTTKKTKTKDTSTLVPTGQTTAVNNIYDIGGNVYEWTTEVSSSADYPCTKRGGGCNYDTNDYPAAYRYYNSTTDAFVYNGFRSTLYL